MWCDVFFVIICVVVLARMGCGVAGVGVWVGAVTVWLECVFLAVDGVDYGAEDDFDVEHG